MLRTVENIATARTGTAPKRASRRSTGPVGRYRQVEKYMPPRKGRRYVLRVIREILFFEPAGRQTNLNKALEFLHRVIPNRAVAVILSDFISPSHHRPGAEHFPTVSSDLAHLSSSALRQANRRHDVVAVHITDRFELELPAIGRLVLKDAETGEVMEINTNDSRKRTRFGQLQEEAQTELARFFRSLRIDAIQVRTDEPYAAALGRFFETRQKRRLHG